MPPDAASLRELARLAIALGILDPDPELESEPQPEPQTGGDPAAEAAPAEPALVDVVAEPAAVAAPSFPVAEPVLTLPVLAMAPLTPVLEIEAPQAAVALLAPPEEAQPAPEPPPPPAEPPVPEMSVPGPLLALAPLHSYSPRTARAIQPAPPKPRILMPDSGPRITLPGPALPPELLSLKDAGVVTVLGDPPSRRKPGVPGWLVSLFVTVVLLVSGLAALFSLLPHSTADAKPAPSDPQGAPALIGSHPLAKYVEVTGFRIVVDFNKKSEIHYIVVNHSGADLSDVNVFVTLRSVSAQPGQPPIGRFSFKSPDLGPFESRELTSSIEKLTRSTTLPEWQDLRAEVQIAQ